MTNDMDRARFAALAEAYGGSIARWPADVRDAARRRASDPACAALLAGADTLDARLDAWTVAPPAASLAAAVMAGASVSWLSRWQSGVWWGGLAGLALAGVAAGAAFVAVALPPPTGEWASTDTAFGVVSVFDEGDIS